jgi:putative hydrolase of the HAD superfamily
VKPVVLFDLDDTLVVERAAAVAAFRATAEGAAEVCDAAALARAAEVRARELWRAAPTHAYCRRVGISSWEGLWCRFEAEGAEVRALRAWAPGYRREAWRLALADQGVQDLPLAADLAERFGVERRARHEVFADAAGCLAELGRSHTLALITNGASCLQREKLAASGLAGHFEHVVVSGELGVAKPDPSIFAHALAGLGADAGHAVMVGDNVIRDVEGALAAGIGAIWLNRAGEAPPRPGVPEIGTLAELPRRLR